MTQLLAVPDLVQTKVIPVASSLVQVSAQHFMCNKCTGDEVSLNAPNFVFTSFEGTSSFSLPPMSGSEIGALALFFNTASQYFGQINFDHIPGFQVTSRSISSSVVQFKFQADPEILAFMGIDGLANLTYVTLNATQINQLAEDLIQASVVCN
jgi:hypothetical protein